MWRYFESMNKLSVVLCYEYSAVPSKNAVSAFKFNVNYFLRPWKIPEEISRRSILFHNWRQYLPYQAYMYEYHISGLTRNWMFNGSIYYVFLLAGTAFLLGAAVLAIMNCTVKFVLPRDFHEDREFTENLKSRSDTWFKWIHLSRIFYYILTMLLI